MFVYTNLKTSIKNKIFSFLALYLKHTFIFLLIYLFTFYLFNELSNYYYCSDIKNLNFELLSLKFPIYLQVSCDMSFYTQGILNLESIFENDYLYQGRPIYILLLYLVHKIITFVSFSNSEIHVYLSVFFSQIFILSFISKILLGLFKTELSKLKENILILFVCLSPIVKFGVFDPSHQILTILSFVISLHFIFKIKELSYRNSYNYALALGVLFLSNKVFFVTFFVLLVCINYDNLVKNKNINPYNFIYSTLLFISPYLVYLLFLKLSGYEIYEAETAEYGHFIWLLYFSNGHIVHEGQWFCHSIPENFICYFRDYLNAIIYMMPVITYLLLLRQNILRVNSNQLKIFSTFEKPLLLITILYSFFWSLMGWFPPLRLSLYVIGIATTIYAINLIFYLSKKNLLLHSFGVSLYFIGLNHWNNPEIINYNFFTTLGVFTMIVNLISVFKLKSQKVD